MKTTALLHVLPEAFSRNILNLPLDDLEELRMRIGQPLLLQYRDKDYQCWPCVEKQHLEEVLQRASKYSPYACADSLREGYLTIEGGYRIGVCGTGFAKDGDLYSLKHPTSILIRVPSQRRGCADKLYRNLSDSTMILGPPGRGKTTLLRDLIVYLSEEGHQRVGLVDERSEIAACVEGIPQFWVGSRTDILVNVRKDIGIMMMMRTMNPQWIAVDEITAERDLLAIEQASYCGVKIIATAHADGVSDLKKRPLYQHMLKTGVFSSAAVLLPDRTYRIEEIAT